MEYNTRRKKLSMPEYGRLIQQMVDYCLTINDAEERQTYAEKIVAVMANMNPQMKNVTNHTQKLWDHLAMMSEYRLQINWPVEISEKRENLKPAKLSYPNSPIKYRHYGKLIEKLAAKLENTADPEERSQLILLTAQRMKQNLVEWKGDGADNEKIATDLESYTHNQIGSAETKILIESAEEKQKATAGYKISRHY